MTATRVLQLLLPWVPGAVAAGCMISMVLSSQIDGPSGLFAALLILGSLAGFPWWPRLAFCLSLLGTVVAAPTYVGYSGLLLALGFAVAAITAWRIEPLRMRLLSGIPLALVAALAISWQVSTHLHTWGVYGQPDLSNVGGPWLVAMLAWAAVIGARALHDALRAESAKEQAVARTTVVESELRDERLRADLTHDFHDVMAHSLAVLAAQAEGLRLSHQQHPERIEPVLTTISDTARLALVEVRQLLERVDDDARRPQATSADIPALIAQLRSAGPSVTLHDIGARGHLSRLADIAAYRIVQESLTNALRHGGSDIEIVVSLTWTGPGLTFSVSSPIADRAALRPAGRGIAGMHERARLAGGSLEIAADGDRFVVSGHLPYEPVSAAPTPPLTEEQLFTLPLPQQQRPEDIGAPRIVATTRRVQEPHPTARALPTDWSQATTVDLTPTLLPDGRIPNPHGAWRAERPERPR